MMRYTKMFLTHVQTALHCSNCQKSPISMLFWWFSERDEKQLRCLFQPQMLHSDAQCFFQPLKKRALPPSKQCSKNEKLWSQKRKQITFCSDIQDSITVFEIRPEYIENPNANSYKFIVWEFQQVVYLIFHRSKSFFEYRILRHFWQYE